MCLLPASGAPIRVDVERLDVPGLPRLRWARDRKSFTFEKADRDRQRFRVIEVDAATGKTRNIIDERTDTFLWTIHAPSTGLMGVAVQYLDPTCQVLPVFLPDRWK